MDAWKQTLPEQIHFIGIGGIGMSALAKHCYCGGFKVTGSDLSEGKMVFSLRDLGIDVIIGHDESNLPVATGLVVKSLAIPDSNPELVAANKEGLRMMSYPEFLGELTKHYTTIAVAGSHGKTTTTGMIAKMMIDLGLDPTVVLGSTASFLDKGNYRHGDSQFLLIEACEYYAGFLHLHPDLTVVVNVEHDHFDAYPTPESYLEAFIKLVDNSNSDYPAIINNDFKMGVELINSVKHKVRTFGASADMTLDVLEQVEFVVPGVHNRTNALAALSVAEVLALDIDAAKSSLAEFPGTARRLEYKDERNGCRIYSDYAHHPTEIRASLAALREFYPSERLAVVFQAHQHHRTQELLADFANSFENADEVIIVPIFSARDSQELQENVTTLVLAEAIAANHNNAKSVTEKTALLALVEELTERFDVLVVMGAGNVEKVVGV